MQALRCKTQSVAWGAEQNECALLEEAALSKTSKAILMRIKMQNESMAMHDHMPDPPISAAGVCDHKVITNYNGSAPT